MNAEDFVSRLNKTRRTGPNSWTACCPAHEDHSPSLAVTEGDDGRILVKCFADCDIFQIVSAVGLDLTDLFPDKVITEKVNKRMRFNSGDVLRALSHEINICYLVISDVKKGGAPSDEDLKRFLLAAERIGRALDYAKG